MRKKISAMLLLFIFVTPAFVSPYLVSAASDISGHWAEELINYSISQGYISGFADGTFRPNSPIKRADFVALTNRYMGFTAAGEARFTDVDAKDWFYREVSIALREGYISGYPDGAFRPNGSVTRETAAVIISNILHLSPNTEYATYFTDAGLLTWSRGAVGAAVKAKVLAGYTNGEFRPRQELTRAEAISLISRVAGRKYDNSLDTLYGNNDYYSNLENYDTGYISEDRINYQKTGLSKTTQPDKDGYYRIYGGDYGTDEKESFYGSVMYDPRYAGEVKNIYVSGDFALTSNINSDSNLTLTDVTIRGKLVIYSVGKVTLNNCEIDQIECQSRSGDAEVYAGSGTTVRETRIYRSVRLSQNTTDERGFRNVYVDGSCRQSDTLTLSGDYPYVSLDGRKANLVIERGKAETIEIAAKGENCGLEVKSGATVNFLDVRSSCIVSGTGIIKNAKITADNAEFSMKPQNISGTKNPVYSGAASNEKYYVDIEVQSGTGAPRSGVKVNLVDFGESYTGSKGKVSFADVPDGTYDCVLSVPNAKDQTERIKVSGRDVSVVFTYDENEEFNVTVTVKMNGAALEGASVIIGTKSGVTNSSGKALFTGVALGTYDCSASYDDGNGLLIKTVSIKVDKNIQQEIVLE